MAEPVAIVRPQGRLDSNSSRAFERDLLARIDGGDRLLLVDFSDLTFIGSAGVRAILVAAKQIKAVCGRLAICSPDTHVREILTVTGCTKLLDVFDGSDAAVAHLSKI